MRRYVHVSFETVGYAARKLTVAQVMKHYNLDAIISAGYRVNLLVEPAE